MIRQWRFGAICCAVAMGIAVSGCDTRDDYYTEHGEMPTIRVGKAEGDTLVYKADADYRNISLRWGESKSVGIELYDYYGSRFANEVVVENATKNEGGNDVMLRHYLTQQTPYRQYDFGSYGGRLFCFSEFLNVRIVQFVGGDDRTSMRLIVEENTNRGIGDIFPTQESAEGQKGWTSMLTSEPVRFTITLKATNALEKEVVFRFNVEITGNRQPVADFTYKCTDEETMEYEIDTRELCTDADGDEITHYEYCFNGETREFANDKGKYYSNTYNEWGNAITDNPDPHFGETAIGGDVITPTKRSVVRHTFQSKGECSIAVRCRDANLCWSEWTEKRFVIE